MSASGSAPVAREIDGRGGRVQQPGAEADGRRYQPRRHGVRYLREKPGAHAGGEQSR